MPTLQTTEWIAWPFPDASYAKNKVGRKWAKGEDAPKQDAEVGMGNPFDAHDKAVALERLRVNHNKMLGQMGVRNTTERSQRYCRIASQSASHIPGKFEEPSYKFTQTPGGLRGGTQYFFYSEEGQGWLQKWKARRIGELNAISKGDFSQGKPVHLSVAPGYDEMDATLAKVLDQFESGAFGGSLIDDLNRLQGALLRVGATIPSRKLAEYVQVFGLLRKQSQRMAANLPVRGVMGIGAEDSAQRKVIRAAGLVVDRLIRLAEEINRVVNEPEDVRQRAVEEIGNRILGAVAREQQHFGSETRNPRRGRPGAPETVQTTGTLEQREVRPARPIEPTAEQELPAGTPPERAF